MDGLRWSLALTFFGPLAVALVITGLVVLLERRQDRQERAAHRGLPVHLVRD